MYARNRLTPYFLPDCRTKKNFLPERMAFSKQACKKLDLFGQHLLKAATTKGSIRVQSAAGFGNYTIFVLTLRLKYTIVFFYKQKIVQYASGS
jgi:hypothetical protein